MNLESPSFAFLGAADVGKTCYWAVAYNHFFETGFGRHRIRAENHRCHELLYQAYRNRIKGLKLFGEMLPSEIRYKVSTSGNFDAWEMGALCSFNILEVSGSSIPELGGCESFIGGRFCEVDGVAVFFDAEQAIFNPQEFVEHVDLIASKILWRISLIDNDVTGEEFPHNLGNACFPVAVIVTKCDRIRRAINIHAGDGVRKIFDFVSFFKAREGTTSELFMTSAVEDERKVINPILFLFRSYLYELQRQCERLLKIHEESLVRARSVAENGICRKALRSLLGNAYQFPETDEESVARYKYDEINNLVRTAVDIMSSLNVQTKEGV